MAEYVVTTLNLSGGISKKMLVSFRHGPNNFGIDKAAARAYRDEMNASDWARITGSVGRWVVVNATSNKIVK